MSAVFYINSNGKEVMISFVNTDETYEQAIKRVTKHYGNKNYYVLPLEL